MPHLRHNFSYHFFFPPALNLSVKIFPLVRIHFLYTEMLKCDTTELSQHFFQYFAELLQMNTLFNILQARSHHVVAQPHCQQANLAHSVCTFLWLEI
jgi:hypothetical protein